VVSFVPWSIFSKKSNFALFYGQFVLVVVVYRVSIVVSG